LGGQPIELADHVIGGYRALHQSAEAFAATGGISDADLGDLIALASTLAVGTWGHALAVVTMAMHGHT
jgi:hypothetical protein